MKYLAPAVILFLCMMVLAAVPCLAQTPVSVDFGFKAGLNIANVSHEHLDNTDSRTGVGFGASLTINIA